MRALPCRARSCARSARVRPVPCRDLSAEVRTLVSRVAVAAAAATFAGAGYATVAQSAAAGGAQGTLPQQRELAERYAPQVRLVVGREDCGPGLHYVPIDVDVLFDEPTVALRGPWGNDLIQIAPIARDLGRGLWGYHLDFPGNALQPGLRHLQLAAATSAPSGRPRPTRTWQATLHTRASSRSSTGSSTSSTTGTTCTRATGR